MVKDYYLVVITLLLIGDKNQGGAAKYGGRLLSYPIRVSEKEWLAHFSLEEGRRWCEEGNGKAAGGTELRGGEETPG